MAGDITGIVAQILSLFAAYGIIALSFNIEYGYTGIPNFGKALFVAIGSYAAGVIAASVLLNTMQGLPPEELKKLIGTTALPRPEGEPLYCTGEARNLLGKAPTYVGTGELLILFLASAVIAMALGAAASIAASYPALRLREDYLAITLLAVSEIFRLVTYNSPWPVCGHSGISGVPGPFAAYSRGDLIYALAVLGLLVLVYLIVDRITNSPWGRALKAVRDDELAAEVYGYDIGKYRMQSLMVGSMLAALGGAVLTFYGGVAAAQSYKPDITFEVITAVILGGAANNLGALVGALVIALLSVLLNPSSLETLGITLPNNVAAAMPYMKYVLIGIAILVILMYRPQGLLPEGPVRTPIIEKTREVLERAAERLARAAGGAAPRSLEEGGEA